MKRMLNRAFLLLLCVVLAFAGVPSIDAEAKSINSNGTRVVGGDAFPNITAPSGSASFTVNWKSEAGADGYLVYISGSTQTYPDETLYAYRYKASGQSTETLVISGIASGTYYVRVVAYIGTTVLQLSHEVTKTAA